MHDMRPLIMMVNDNGINFVVLGCHPSWYINANLVISHSPKVMRYFLICLFACLPAFITACGSSVPIVKPFKMDIQQGNVVTSKMLLQLRPGMTKSQVRFIMGTPLMVDSFHKDRWDYFYQLRQAGKIVEQRRVILDFEKDLLTKIRGDVVPESAASKDAAGADASAASLPKSIAPKPKETGILDKLKFWKKDDKITAPLEVPKALERSKVAPAKSSPNAEQPNAGFPKSDMPVQSMPEQGQPVQGAPVPSTPEPSAPVTNTPDAEPDNAAAPASVLAVPIDIGSPVEPASATAPAVENSGLDQSKPEQPKAQQPVSAPIKAAPATLDQPSAAVKSKDDTFSFRLDKKLDAKNLDSSDAPQQTNAASKPKKVEEPAPAEAEPSYFDKILEKIGF